MSLKSKWVDNRCCDWDTFLAGFMEAAERAKVPLLIIDRCEARRLWRRHSCTGSEALYHLKAELLSEIYYW